MLYFFLNRKYIDFSADDDGIVTIWYILIDVVEISIEP